MKNLIITLVFLASIIASGQAQEKLKVGEIKNGKLNFTNLDAFKAYIMNSLEKSGSLSREYQVSTSPEGDRFYVSYSVSGNKNKVNNIGVMLVRVKDDAFIVENPPETDSPGPGAGGSFEVQCLGSCPTCMPVIRWVGGSWLPIVYCDCTQGNSGDCTMISKLTISVKIGL
jgi:hypothetical protein